MSVVLAPLATERAAGTFGSDPRRREMDVRIILSSYMKIIEWNLAIISAFLAANNMRIIKKRLRSLEASIQLREANNQAKQL